VNLGAERWAVGLGSGDRGGVCELSWSKGEAAPYRCVQEFGLDLKSNGGCFVKDCLRAHVGRIQAGKPVEAWVCGGSLNGVLVEETDVDLQ